MKRLGELESVGWGFFAITAALLSPPCIWLVWVSAKPESSVFERVLLAVVLAVVLAAFVAWLVNDQLYRRMVRRQAIEEKTVKQKKPKK